MALGRVGAAAAAAVLATAAAGGAAWASGAGGTFPWYVDRFGGEPAEQQALYGGRLGVVMAYAPKPQLYIAWRLLHGQKVGPQAGEALSVPCCSPPSHVLYDETRPTGAREWLTARKLVQGAPKRDYAPTGDAQPYFMWSETCFDDAFRNAAATLKLRVAKHGAASPWVQAWLDAQDAVFANCRNLTPLPPVPAGAPGWLKADRAYQEAAYNLYTGHTEEAAAGFGAIARDRSSPYQPMGAYLRARTYRRAALLEPTPARFVQARAAIGELARQPVGAFGRGEVTPMLRSLAYRDRPRELMAELVGDLSRPDPVRDIAVSFRDVTTLVRGGQPAPDMVDWMATMRPEVDYSKAAPKDMQGEGLARLEREVRGRALAHAQARWSQTRDVAWLVAALTLADPGTAEAAALAAPAGRIAPSDPAWLTVQYHLIRLGLRVAPPAVTRAKLDAILARKDLSISDRNIFTAQRMQVAADAKDFVRHALRRRVCAEAPYTEQSRPSGCHRNAWLTDHGEPTGIYDGIGAKGAVGLGDDARAVIDRLPLAERIAISRDPNLPGQLRLDVALTSYARAVLLQDHAAVDGLAADLTRLLPQLAPEWRRIRATPVGPAKRFAEFFVLAKVPGIRPDLVDLTRPEGTVAQFQYYWIDWTLVPKGRPAMPAPPPLAAYAAYGYGVESADPDATTDLACLGECAAAPSPLRLPDFAAAAQERALVERGYILRRLPEGFSVDDPPARPPGAVAVWDEMLAYAYANPKDPQVPEALYWINRAGRWGGSHERSGMRAFRLLHDRYASSSWAKRSPYFWD